VGSGPGDKVVAVGDFDGNGVDGVMVANANGLETLENFAIYDSSNQYAN